MSSPANYSRLQSPYRRLHHHRQSPALPPAFRAAELHSPLSLRRTRARTRPALMRSRRRRPSGHHRFLHTCD